MCNLYQCYKCIRCCDLFDIVTRLRCYPSNAATQLLEYHAYRCHLQVASCVVYVCCCAGETAGVHRAFHGSWHRHASLFGNPNMLPISYTCCVFTHSLTHSFSNTCSHTHTHSLSLVLVVVMTSKELKTKISHTHSLILTHSLRSSQTYLLSLTQCLSLRRCLSLRHSLSHTLPQTIQPVQCSSKAAPIRSSISGTAL